MPMTKAMQSAFRASVTVGALATQRRGLPDTLTCREIDQWFREDDERRSVVLTRPDGTPALINRSAFYQYMLGPAGFGWALYAHNPVSLLPTAAGLVVHADTPAVEAALRLLVEEKVSSSDDLLVVGGSALATISTSVLLAELARAQSEQAGRLEALVQNLSDVIVVVDEDGTIRYTTAADKDAAANRAGRSCLDDVHPDDQATFQRLLREACEQANTTIRGEVRLRGASGGYLLIAVAVTDRGPTRALVASCSHTRTSPSTVPLNKSCAILPCMTD